MTKNYKNKHSVRTNNTIKSAIENHKNAFFILPGFYNFQLRVKEEAQRNVSNHSNSQ